MKLRTKIQGRLLASTIFASTALVASPAFAQGGQPAATAEEEGNDQAIVVTGTLVRNPNLVASSPVNTVGEEEIELQQANVAEELLRDLPGAVSVDRLGRQQRQWRRLVRQPARPRLEPQRRPDRRRPHRPGRT